MKFKLDENLGTLGQDVLVIAGHDVMTVAQQGLSGATDERLYEVCQDEQRVLVTIDQDFCQVLRFPPDATAGIVVLVCRGKQSTDSLRARIGELATMLQLQPIDRELWIIEPGRVRIHQRRDH